MSDNTNTGNEEEEDSRFILKPQKRTLIERWRDLTPPTKKKIKILVLCAIGITGIVLLFNPIKEMYMEWAEKRKVEASYKELLEGKEEELQKAKASLEELKLKVKIDDFELKKKLAAMEKEVIGVSNIYFTLQEENDKLMGVVKSNNVERSKATLPSNSNPAQTTPHSQPTNQLIQTESPNRIGSGLVTVIDNHGDIRITVESDAGRSNVRTSNSPDKAEDLILNLAEANGDESPRTTYKVVPAGGNGMRYYIPKGWSVNYKYPCSENDFETSINKGSREVPKWEAIDVSSDGTSESIWFRNLSRRSIRFVFTLTPTTTKK